MSGARAATALVLLAALLVAGCGDTTSIRGGGVVASKRLTIYSLLPAPSQGARRDIVDGERLALQESGARVGRFTLNFASLDQTAGAPGVPARERFAAAARQAIADPQVIAAIGDLGADSAQVSVPLLNAAGILHVSPGVTSLRFTVGVDPGEPERYYPAGARTFFPLAADEPRQARALAAALRGRVVVEQEESAAGRAFGTALRAALGPDRLAPDARSARAAVYAGEGSVNASGVIEALLRENPRLTVYVPASADVPPRPRVRVLGVWPPPSPELARGFRAAFGREATPAAMAGYEAMRGVLAALRRAGSRANSRQAVIDAFTAERRAEPPVFLGTRRLP